MGPEHEYVKSKFLMRALNRFQKKRVWNARLHEAMIASIKPASLLLMDKDGLA
jgi:hypothetical protein